MDKIRIGIVGYGNIGRGVEKAIARNEEMCIRDSPEDEHGRRYSKGCPAISPGEEAGRYGHRIDVYKRQE